jgi:pyruvate ferredoxin oxidoreductase gamma subunit
MGAPVMSFCRIADTRIRAHDPVVAPDAVVVADATLLHHVDVFSGLGQDGYALINSVRGPGELGLDGLVARLGPGRVQCLPASDIARERIGRPVPNICLLGALAAMTWIVTLDSLAAAVQQRFPEPIADANIAALRAAAELLAVGHA